MVWTTQSDTPSRLNSQGASVHVHSKSHSHVLISFAIRLLNVLCKFSMGWLSSVVRRLPLACFEAKGSLSEPEYGRRSWCCFLKKQPRQHKYIAPDRMMPNRPQLAWASRVLQEAEDMPEIRWSSAMSSTPPRFRGLAGGARRTSLNLCGHSKPVVHWRDPCWLPQVSHSSAVVSAGQHGDHLFSRWSRPSSVDVLSSARNLGRVRNPVAGGQGCGVDVSDQMSQNRLSKRGGVGPMWPVMLSFHSVKSNQASCRNACNPGPRIPGQAGQAEFPAHIPFAPPRSGCHPNPKRESCSQCVAGAKDSNDASRLMAHCYRSCEYANGGQVSCRDCRADAWGIQDSDF
jgi:hypothetical protein